MKAIKTIGKFTLLVLVLPLVLFFVLEGLTRAKVSLTEENYRGYPDPTPPVLYPLRCYTHAAPEAFRIVAIGGSTTYGVMLPCSDTYSTLLEKQLKFNFPFHAVEVINAGVSGLSAQGALERFRQVIIPLEPEVLVFNSVLNHLAQIFDLITTDGKIIYENYVIKIKWNNPLLGLNYFLLRNSLFYARLREKVTQIRGHRALEVWRYNVPFTSKVYEKRTISQQELNQKMESLVASYEEVVKELVDLVSEHRIRVILVKPPMRLAFSPVSNEWRPIDRDYLKHKLLLEFILTVDRLGRKYQIPVVDAYGTFKSSARPGLFIDDMHLTKEGNELMASVLKETLVSNNFFPPVTQHP